MVRGAFSISSVNICKAGTADRLDGLERSTVMWWSWMPALKSNEGHEVLWSGFILDHRMRIAAVKLSASMLLVAAAADLSSLLVCLGFLFRCKLGGGG